MRFHYDKKEDAFYLRFNDNAYEESDEVKEGIILDYDKEGRIVGLEILDASQRLPRKFKAELVKKKMSWQVA